MTDLVLIDGPLKFAVQKSEFWIIFRGGRHFDEREANSIEKETKKVCRCLSMCAPKVLKRLT